MKSLQKVEEVVPSLFEQEKLKKTNQILEKIRQASLAEATKLPSLQQVVELKTGNTKPIKRIRGKYHSQINSYHIDS